MQSVSTIRHTDATRQAILRAGMELLLERRSDGFSIQEVADRAGLTHRTIYRYFPSRLELMAAIARSLGPDMTDDSFRSVSTVEEWIEAAGPHLARTEANFDVVRSLLAAVFAADDLVLFSQRMRERDAHRWQVFRRQFSRLPETDARRTFATLRHLTSSASYILYRLRFGMSPAEAVETIKTTARRIVREADRRNRAVSRSGR